MAVQWTELQPGVKWLIPSTTGQSTVFLCTRRIWWGVTGCVCCPSLQIESPVIPGGVAGWGERRGPGGHDVGDADVPVWKEGKPSMPGKAATEQLKPHGKYDVKHWQRQQQVTELRLECWEACYVAQYDSRVIHLPLGEDSEAVMTDQLPFSAMQVWRLKIVARPLRQQFLSLMLLTQPWVADMTKPLLLIPACRLVSVPTRLVGDAHEELWLPYMDPTL